MITITAYNWVPDFARGQVRDLRVRWALEEAGLPYQIRFIAHGDNKKMPYLGVQPFGQVPVFEEDGFHIFESGAICLHIAERSEALLPSDANARARAISWTFAALNSVEPEISAVLDIYLFHKGEAWVAERLPQVEASLQRRLDFLAGWLDGKDWLEDQFTVGDLTMAAVLRSVTFNKMVSDHPVLGAYVERCTARPAFRRALNAHLADLKGPSPFG